MENLISTQNTGVITLKEITDLIDVRHDKAKLKVEELMKEPSFGEVSKIDTFNLNNVKVETYLLNKKQAIAVGARLIISNVVHSENTYTATQVAKDFNISAKLFNKILVEIGVLYYNNGTYALTSKYQSFNLTTIKETTPNNDNKTFLSLRWTAIGKNWLKNNWDKALQRCKRETFDEYNIQVLRNLPVIPMPKKSERNF